MLICTFIVLYLLIPQQDRLQSVFRQKFPEMITIFSKKNVTIEIKR